MRIFGINEAYHYCVSNTHQVGTAEGSLDSFFQNNLQGQTQRIRETTPIFNEFRSCSLRYVERNLFLAASHYRRFLDLMIPSSSHWSYVTAYYGSWFSAHALLGMFGCSIIHNNVIDVSQSSPGSQELRIRGIGNRSGQQHVTHSGSHQRFWELFYLAVTSLRPLIPITHEFCLSPISSNPIWQIQERNRINYNTHTSINLAIDFGLNFSPATFPSCLPGSLNTQYRIFDALLEISFSFAERFRIQTDALYRLNNLNSLRENVRNLIYNAHPPGLVRRTKKVVIT